MVYRRPQSHFRSQVNVKKEPSEDSTDNCIISRPQAVGRKGDLWRGSSSPISVIEKNSNHCLLRSMSTQFRLQCEIQEIHIYYIIPKFAHSKYISTRRSLHEYNGTYNLGRYLMLFVEEFVPITWIVTKFQVSMAIYFAWNSKALAHYSRRLFIPT